MMTHFKKKEPAVTTALLLSGSSNTVLAAQVAHGLGIELGQCRIERFPDGELDIELVAEVKDRDVYVMQSLMAPVGEHLLELSLLVDTCHRGGAQRVSAVVPYLGYARQDRRESAKEPLGARVMAELLATRPLHRLICLDLHSRAVEGCFPTPVEHATAVPSLAEHLKKVPGPGVVVSPDLGGLKRAEAYAKQLGLPVALVHKERLSGSDVSARAVVGDVKGRHVLVVDDMISTGGTMAAAVTAVLAAGALGKVTLAATHGLFVGQAVERLKGLPLERIWVSNSVPVAPNLPLPVEVVSAAPALMAAMQQWLR